MTAALDRVLAVVRPDADDDLDRILRAAGCELVHCPSADQGMGASLACGVRGSPEADGWIVALADMPWIRPGTIASVARTMAEGAPLAAPAHHGRRGHPVGFAATFGDDLAALSGDRGARDLLAAHREQLALIDTDDPGILADIDHPDDLGPVGT